jgi:hypothetical protein
VKTMERKLALVDEILERAHGYLEEGWCQDNYAVDQWDDGVDPVEDVAVKWCVTGAVARAMYALDMTAGLHDIYSDPTTGLIFTASLARIVRAAEIEDTLACHVAPGEPVRSIEGAVVSWNDDLGRSREDILLAVKKAAYQ